MKLSDFSKYSILCSTLILCGLLFSFLHNLKSRFDKVEQDYHECRAVNLSSKNLDNGKLLSDLLYANGYVANRDDADYIADTLAARLRRQKITNLYDLQKRSIGKVPMLVADSAGVLANKIAYSNEQIGLSDELPNVDSLPVTLDIQNGNGEIKVIVKSDNDTNIKDVLVRLEEHYLQGDSVVSTVVGYVKTDTSGLAVITGLDRQKGYSVLPIRRGFEYGKAKGIVCGHFDEFEHFPKFGKKRYIFTFYQQEHQIQMIDNATLKQIKNDGTLTVRTPSEYVSTVIRWFVFVLLGWWILCLILIHRKNNFDPLMISAAMFLTCFCVLIMFSIQNPLTEDLRGVDMAKGVLIGLGGVIVLLHVDFVKFYRNQYKLGFDVVLSCFNWLFLPFKKKVSWLSPILIGDNAWWKKSGAFLLLLLSMPFGVLNLFRIDLLSKFVTRMCDKLPKGFGWFAAAVLLTALLWTPLGQSIGGMKVNLRLGGFTFQPSEVAKYLIMFFMAAFFTQKADTIIDYSRPMGKQMKKMLLGKTKTLAWVICGLVVIMMMYAILGDMGPGLVIGVSFVLLYSLVKSKVNLDNLNENDKWQRIFTCDFAMLLYGVVSFAVFVVVGGLIGDSLTGALLWFLGWIVFGWTRHKQFFETAFIMNLLVFAFVFGGQVMQELPILEGTDIAERFEQRTKMCSNKWGDLDVEYSGANAEAVSNSQIANGLWGLATGGMLGQGLGNGNPNLIPAFHTDMILSSIGEQTGWFGLLIVVLFLALLLRRMIVVGYHVGHPFAFYFCTGVAIVTGVQFFIIALGSSGMIPLTGITVPFLSYGRVSMILNLVAFGVILSLSQNVKEYPSKGIEEMVQQRSVGDYNYPASIVSWTFVVLAFFTLGVWQYYGLWNRGNTLVHPAFVYSRQGTPLIEYNPRIALLTKEMWAGDIYDRNGILIATSDKNKIVPAEYERYGLDKTRVENCVKDHQKRYYPFGEHLFFMLGNQNNGLFFNYNENDPKGFMAEAQYLTYLRDYDNLMRDKDGNVIKVKLKDKTKNGNRFVEGIERDTTIKYAVRDNSELIKYLKKGTNGRILKKHNKKVKDGCFDLYMTLDAKLQTIMQNNLVEYVKTSAQKDNNLLRISVVVLDAHKGDLLTSANYPLPDYVRLREEDDNKSYSDNYKDKDWLAYTDRDLGLTYQTMPGSAAKIMSAMAGLNKLGVDKVRREAIFPIYRYEVLDIIYNSKTKKYERSLEPPMGYDKKVMVNMKDAIVLSSNCYFIHLVNYYDCYSELERIYAASGISLKSTKAYSLHYKPSEILKSVVLQTQLDATQQYKEYLDQRNNGVFENNNVSKTLGKGIWMWAWGQGSLDASPLNMARVVSAVANDGMMPVTRYLLKTSDRHKNDILPSYVQLTTKDRADELKSYMKAQAARYSFPSTVGGKTGTPERNRIERKVKKYDKNARGYTVQPGQSHKINDGWYVFFMETGDEQIPTLAVAIRMERIKGETSGAAMRLAKLLVIKSLNECGYLKQ